MMNLGDFAVGKIALRPFTSNNAVGVPISMTGSPAFAVYKNNTTSSSTAGITFIADVDGRTGFNEVRVDTSADGTFYSSGSDFTVVITAGTISGQNVAGTTIALFSIENRSALRPSVAGHTLGVNTGGQAGIDWANIGAPTTTVDLSGTTIKNLDNPVAISAASVQAIWDALTSALTTSGSIGRLLVTNIDATISSRLAAGSYTTPPTAAAIAIAVWAVLTSTLTTVGTIGKLLVDNINAAISTRLATSGYTAPDNAGIAAIKFKTDNLPADPASESNVSAVGSAVLTRQSTATALTQFNTLVSDIGAISSITPTEVADAVWDADLVDHDIAGSFGANAQNPPLDPTQIADAVWDAELVDHDTAGTFGNEVQSGVPVDPAVIADAVWDAQTADHVEVGSMGLALGQASAGGGGSTGDLVGYVDNDELIGLIDG